MCPSAARPRASTSLARRSTTSHGRRAGPLGSRLPCSALPDARPGGPPRPGGTCQSDTDRRPRPASLIRPQQFPRCRPRSGAAARLVPAERLRRSALPCGEHRGPVVLRAERADPGVEQLDRREAPAATWTRRNAMVMSVQPGEQGMPQRAGRRTSAPWSAPGSSTARLHQVGRQRERAAQRNRSAAVRAQLGHQRADRRGQVRTRRTARAHAAGSRSARARTGCPITGPMPGLMSMSTPDRRAAGPRCR